MTPLVTLPLEFQPLKYFLDLPSGSLIKMVQDRAQLEW